MNISQEECAASGGLIPIDSLDYHIYLDTSSRKLVFKGDMNNLRENTIISIAEVIQFTDFCGYLYGYNKLALEIAGDVYETRIRKFMTNDTLDLAKVLDLKQAEEEMLQNCCGRLGNNGEREEIIDQLNRKNRHTGLFLLENELQNRMTSIDERKGHKAYDEVLNTVLGDMTFKEIIDITTAENVALEIYCRGEGGWGIYAFGLAQEVHKENELAKELLLRAEDIYQATYVTALDFFKNNGLGDKPAKELAKKTINGLRYAYERLLYRKREYSGNIYFEFNGKQIKLEPYLEGSLTIEKYGNIAKMYDKCPSDLEIAKCITTCAAEAVWDTHKNHMRLS